MSSPDLATGGSSLIPEDYLPYLSYLPDLQHLVNLLMTFTPMFSYGTTCLGIYRRQTSMGFSIDICGTMMIASILRIAYYTCAPFEITLLRQSMVMILIQSVLLYTSLKYRGDEYDPSKLMELPPLAHEVKDVSRRSRGLSCVGHEKYDAIGGVVRYVACLVWEWIKWVGDVVVTVVKAGMRLFDVYYRRPLLFWQWRDPMTYWKFLAGFAGVVVVLTAWFYTNESYANAIGVSGLFIEALLPLPQILMLNRLQSIENFKLVLLLSWLGGDCTKLSYLLFGTSNISLIFILAGFFQMSLDIYIAFQFITLKYYYDHWWRDSNSDSAPSVDDIVGKMLIHGDDTYELSNMSRESYEKNTTMDLSSRSNSSQSSYMETV
ncbi:uncharacterized protein LODBEIA_P27490 [Lodderomyces beijingensis]|uniref:PQ-loop repeat-containing protein 1 n=1 Tax=Lodderomyces beijingensis TaxID=1775926 RepID=A0ABP0ZMU2_9ASCO